MDVSTHTPPARCDLAVFVLGGRYKFLLTHLLRGVTPSCPINLPRFGFLLTHLLRGVTYLPDAIQGKKHVSTHTPPARCDFPQRSFQLIARLFLLTHLLRGVTYPLPGLQDTTMCFYSHTSCEV